MTNHTFNVEVATKYSPEEAIILHNIAFWMEKNLANNVNIHEGRVWTFNSRKAFNIIFPYFSSDKIGRILRKLESRGVIVSGNFNNSSYNHTKWYTIIDEWVLEQEKCCVVSPS